MRILVPTLLSAFLFASVALAAEECEVGADGSCVDSSSDCTNLGHDCDMWAGAGECKANPGYMLRQCAKSCNACLMSAADIAAAVAAKPDCEDGHEKCDDWTKKGECEANPNYMLLNCKVSCETCGLSDTELKELSIFKTKLHEVGGDETVLETSYGMEQTLESDAWQGDLHSVEKIQKVIANFTEYMEQRVFKEDLYKDVRKTCRNRDRNCAFWGLAGKCESDKVFMEKQCAPTCNTCEKLSFLFRCPLNESIPEAFKAGDVNKMFERITQDDYYKQFEPVILSMPNPPADSGILDGPWVVTLESLLTAEECDRMVDLGADEGYRLSADVGKKKFDGTYERFENSGRTSTNAWCNNDCMKDPTTITVNGKIANITGIPEPNSEFLQLLRYEPGQFYNTHHDYIEHHTGRQSGVRMLTVFLYLNDVEEGGGTEFPGLELTVMPKKGKALIWPSVFDHDPNAKDNRTEHGALPVIAGIKYGCNAWIHQRDFKEAYRRGCQ